MPRKNGAKQNRMPGRQKQEAKVSDTMPKWIANLAADIELHNLVPDSKRREKPRKSDIRYSKLSQASVEADKRVKKRRNHRKGRR